MVGHIEDRPQQTDSTGARYQPFFADGETPQAALRAMADLMDREFGEARTVTVRWRALPFLVFEPGHGWRAVARFVVHREGL